LSDINKKMAKGAAWMVLFKFVERGIGLASTVVLARLLTPADFGLVAMAMSLIAMLELLGAFSFDWSLIQREEAKSDHFNTAWTFTVLFAMSCAAVLVASSGFAADFYQEPRLREVMCVLAVGTLIQGFENIGVVSFRRELQFNREFKFLLAKKLAAVAVTIPLAFATRSYWALVAGVVFGKAVSVTFSYVIHSYRPRFSLAAFGDLFHFSKWLLINNVISFLNNRSADFVIGKLAGAPALGLYSIAYEISNLPTTELVAPINRAAFPGYSRLANDLVKLRESFMGVIGMIAMMAMPAAAGIAMVADLLVPVMLGDKWLAVVPVIQVLAFYGAIMSLQSNIVYVYVAIGKPRLVTLIGGIQVVILLVSLFSLIPKYGVMGAAWAFLLTAIVLIPVNQWVVAAKLELSVRAYLLGFWRPMMATLAMVIVVMALRDQISSPLEFEQQVGALLLLSLVGAGVYVSLLLGLWRLSSCPDGPERFCVTRFKEFLCKVRLLGRVS